MKIAVILVNYNGAKYNMDCIESILSSQDGCEKKILIVDNNSQDDSVEILEKIYADNPHIELIQLDSNYGFAAANNKGIMWAGKWGADYVLLLNNDTEIDTHMIDNMVKCAGRHSGSVIVPKIYYSSDKRRIWFAGGSVSKIIKKVRHDGINQIDEKQFDKEKKIRFATGCCLFIPISVIEHAGILDEQFFLYYEDVEYCFRLEKENVAIYYCPEAYMYHKVGASSKGADSPLCAYYISRNWLLCNRKHLRWRYPIFVLYYIINRMVCVVLWLLRGRTDLVKALFLAVRDYKNGKMGYVSYFDVN